MKNILITLVSVLVVFSSCNEIMPTIPPPGSISSDRVILVEEFTGVGCQNCPGGSAELENLLAIYPDNLIAVSIHAGFFASEVQWNDNQRFDFRTADGDNLVNDYFGGAPFAFPSATINRELTNASSLYSTLTEWPATIESELAEGGSVELTMSRTYDAASRELNVDVDILALSALPEDVRIAVIITESGIVDYQKDLNAPGDGWIEDYVHKHVLRDYISPFDGEVVSQTGVGLTESVSKSFSTILPNNFVAENCEVIAFVHRNTSDSKEVLQAIEMHVVE